MRDGCQKCTLLCYSLHILKPSSTTQNTSEWFALKIVNKAQLLKKRGGVVSMYNEVKNVFFRGQSRL